MPVGAAGQDVAAPEDRGLVAGPVGAHPPRLADQKGAGRDVPEPEPELEEATPHPGRTVGQVEGGGPHPAEVLELPEGGAGRRQVARVPFRMTEGESGGGHPGRRAVDQAEASPGTIKGAGPSHRDPPAAQLRSADHPDGRLARFDEGDADPHHGEPEHEVGGPVGGANTQKALGPGAPAPLGEDGDLRGGGAQDGRGGGLGVAVDARHPVAPALGFGDGAPAGGARGGDHAPSRLGSRGGDVEEVGGTADHGGKGGAHAAHDRRWTPQVVAAASREPRFGTPRPESVRALAQEGPGHYCWRRWRSGGGGPRSWWVPATGSTTRSSTRTSSVAGGSASVSPSTPGTSRWLRSTPAFTGSRPRTAWRTGWLAPRMTSSSTSRPTGA